MAPPQDERLEFRIDNNALHELGLVTEYNWINYKGLEVRRNPGKECQNRISSSRIKFDSLESWKIEFVEEDVDVMTRIGYPQS